MAKIVTLRKSGNSRVLTVPNDLDVDVGTQYQVKKLPDGGILYQPIKRQNIFATPDWQEYAYQADLRNDPELGPAKPVGKECVEWECPSVLMLSSLMQSPILARK